MQQAAQQMQQMPPGKRMKAMPESAAKRAASPQRQSRRGAAFVSYKGMDDSADMGMGKDRQLTPSEALHCHPERWWHRDDATQIMFEFHESLEEDDRDCFALVLSLERIPDKWLEYKESQGISGVDTDAACCGPKVRVVTFEREGAPPTAEEWQNRVEQAGEWQRAGNVEIRTMDASKIHPFKPPPESEAAKAHAAGDTEDEEDQDTPNETFSRRSSMGGALKSADPAQQTQYAKNQKAWERRARDVLKRQSKNIKDRVTSGHSPQRMSIDEVTSLLVNDTTKTKDKPGVVIWNAERIRKFCEKRNFGILVTDEKRGEKRAHDDTASGGQGAAEVQLLPSPAVVFTNLTLSYRDSIANIFRQESPNIGSVSSDALEWLDVQLTDFLKQLLSGLTSTTSITVLKARAEVLMGKNSEVTKLVNREIDRRVGSYTSNEENEVEMSACEEEEEEQFDPKKVKAVGPALDIQMCVGIAALLECLCAEILELAAYTKMDEEADRCGVPRRAASLT